LGYDPAGFFILGLFIKDRVTFIVDGFNLYHSVKEAQKALQGKSTRWLDLYSLCKSYLHLFGRTAELEKVYYFSALAKHLEYYRPQVTKRHRDYIQCLQASGVITQLNRFKKKDVFCSNCKTNIVKYEEKETDVAIAVKLLELLIKNECDTAVLVTGDTDLGAAFRTADSLFHAKRIVFAFPYRRKNRELSQLAPGSFEIKKEQYHRHQFSDPFLLPGGHKMDKPQKW